MDKVMNFESWSSSRNNTKIEEAKGISPAVFPHLEDCIKKHGKDCTYEMAAEYVASKVDGWKLSKEDYEEAKKANESVTNETENLASKGYPSDDLKSNFRSWETDHEEDGEELFDILKKRHPKDSKAELKKLAYEWVGQELKESEVIKIDEGKMKEIDILSQESTSKEDFIEKLKAYVKELGKPELANDKDFIDAFAADWKPSTKED